jgi:hypothetical protein
LTRLIRAACVDTVYRATYLKRLTGGNIMDKKNSSRLSSGNNSTATRKSKAV